MKINNVLKSLSWNSLLRAARKSSLRRSRTNWSLSALVAVDVLEPRSMLSGPTANVTAAVSGPNIVLSSDNTGNHSINVFRLNATTVEVDAVAGTVNGKSSVLLNISTVTGITVNLGNAYDTYNIYSKSGSPALNVGIGGITFQGAGGTGNDLRVHNDSANAMSIIGNVTVQGTTVGSWLTQSGSSSSYFGLYTNSTGSLTLQNNVSVALKATGTENISSEIYTGAAGNLSILGAVTQKQTLTTGVGENGIFSGGTGNLTIAYGIQQSQVGLAPGSSNFVSVGYAGSDFESYPTSASSGSVSIAHIGIAQSSNNTVFNQNLVTLVSGTTSSMTVYGTVTQTATTAALDLNGPIITDFPSDAANVISNDTGGALTIGGNVAQNSSGYFGNNLIELYAAGNIAIQGTVTQTNTSSSSANNFVGVSGNGTLSVSASLTQSATSAGGAFNLLSSQYSEAGKVSIVTTVTQNASTGLSFSALALEGFATQNDIEVAGASFSVGGISQTANSFASGANSLIIGGIAAATITNGVTQSVLGNPLNGGNNEVEVFDFAVAKVGQFIQQSSVGQSSNGNVVGALFGGALSVGGGGVKMSVTNSNSLGIDVNELFAYEGGTFSTTGVIVMNSAITLGAETVARPLAGPIDFFTNGNLVGTSFGSISALGVQMNTSGTASQQNIVGIEDTIESGATAGDPVLSTINIGNSGIVMKDSGPGACLSQVLNYSNNAGSAINVTGSVNVTDTGSGTSEFDIVADSVGSITVGGVNYDNHLNTTTFSNVAILGNSPGNAHVTINGPLTIYLSQHVATPVVTANSLLGGLFPTNNLVELGNVDGDSGTGYGLVVKLNTSITGSNGEDDVHIDAAQFNSWVNVDLKTNAAFIPANPVLGVNTLGVGADYVDIEGSLFLNTATFTLAGDNAQIDINNGTSIQTTTFTRQFSAIMKGASPVINISAGSAFGYGSVVFSIGGVAYGTLGAGGVINYNPLNVSGSFVGYNFTKVQVP